MAFQTKDKKKMFGSKMVADRYDREHANESDEKDERHEAKESPDFEAGEQEGKVEKAHEQENEPQSAHEVVAQHGKAHSVHVHHDHKNNKHKVVSHHEDGHMHEADHGSPSEAYQHASELGSADSEDLKPQNAMNAMSAGASEGPSSGIPGLE